MITQLAERDLKTEFGTFTERMYSNEVIVLTKGELTDKKAVLCRIHSSCLSGHAFGSIECRCQEEMAISQRMIQNEGRGIIIWLEQEGRGNGHLAVMKTHELKKQGISQSDAYESLGYQADARSFEPASDVIKELGVKSVQLLSGSSKKADQLSEFGIEVSGITELEP